MAAEVEVTAVLLNERTLSEYVNDNGIGIGCYAFQMNEEGGEALVLDSIDKLANDCGVRCLAIAAKKFRQKLAHGLAALYAHIDKPNTDHGEVLLGLKGGAYIKTLPKARTTPAYCSLAGIHFNAELIGASESYLDHHDLNSEDAILNDRHGAAYVAILELSITHEFGHMKLQRELDDKHNTGEDEEETANISELIQLGQLHAADQYPLYSEAGYSIEARIRETFFDEKVPVADRPRPQEDTEEVGRRMTRSSQAAQQE